MGLSVLTSYIYICAPKRCSACGDVKRALESSERELQEVGGCPVSSGSKSRLSAEVENAPVCLELSQQGPWKALSVEHNVISAHLLPLSSLRKENFSNFYR